MTTADFQQLRQEIDLLKNSPQITELTNFTAKQSEYPAKLTEPHSCQFCEDKKMLKVELGKLFTLIAEYDKHIDSGGKLDINTYRTFKLSLKTKAKQLKQFHLS